MFCLSLTVNFYILQADVYKSVVNDVIEGVREAFLDDGMDDQVLQELRQVCHFNLKCNL